MGVDVEVGLGTYQGASIPIEGYGKNVTGGQGQTVRTVTSEARTGSGSLQQVLATYHDNMIVQFAEGVNTGRIDATDAFIRSNVTIDGFANGHTNGVTIDSTDSRYSAMQIVGSSGGPTGNVLIRGLNFRGAWDLGVSHSGPNVIQDDLIRIDAAHSGDVTDGVIDGVLVERCTFYNSSDGGLDINSNGPGFSIVKNVTIQQCLFSDCGGCMLIKYGGVERTSIHHNVYVHNGERNPQIKGTKTIQFENNIIFQNLSNASYPANYRVEHWDGGDLYPYGIRIWCSTQDFAIANGNPVVNVRGCAFLGDKAGTQINVDSGASDENVYFDLQGTSANNNYWDATPDLESSPKPTPNTVDSGYEVTRHTIPQLKTLLSQIGCPLRLDTDQQRLDDIYNYFPV